MKHKIKLILYLFLFLGFINMSRAALTLYATESFDYANGNLGNLSNWTRYVDAGTEAQIVDFQVQKTVAAHETTHHYIGLNLSQVGITRIQFLRMFDNAPGTNNHEFRFYTTDTLASVQAPDGTQGIVFTSYVTKGKVVYDGAAWTELDGWGDYVQGQYFNVTFNAINWTTGVWNLTYNGVDWGQFAFKDGANQGKSYFAIFFKTLATSADLHTDNISFYYEAGATPGVPGLTLSTDLAASSYNDDPFIFNFSGSVTFTDEIFNCSLYLNGTLNQSINDVNISASQNFQMNTTAVEESYGVNVTCLNSNATDDFVYNIYIDTIQPDETTTGVYNGMTLYKNLTASSFYWNTTIYDVNLLAINISFGNSSDVLVNIFNDSLDVDTFNNYTELNLNNYTPGAYNLHIQAWDDHTAKKIKDNYKIDYLANGFTIDDDIKIYGDEIKSSLVWFDDVKEDRYKFKITFHDDVKTHSFYLETTEKAIYRPGSEHLGHFAYIPLNKWIDFNSDKIKSLDVETLAPNKFKINIELYIAKDEIEYDSIGDLNTIDETYNITLAESFYIWAYDRETNLTINEFITRAYNGSEEFFYNASAGVAIFNQTGAYNFTINATSFVTTEFLNIQFNTSDLYNAYVNASNAFKVFIRDQLDNVLIQPQTVYLEFIGTNSSNTSTATGYKYITTLAPDDYIIRYSSANYSNAFYYFTLENQTNILFTIYMLPNTSTDDVTATVIDEVNNELEGAFIHVQRYDLNDNAYKTVEILKTNFEGQAVLHVTKNTEFYKFLIYYGGDLKKTTAPTYIYEDDITFQIQLGDAIAEDFYTTQGVAWDLTFNTATKNFNFQYSDATNTITLGELILYNVSAGNAEVYNYTSAASAAATLLLTAHNVSGRTYRADGFVMVAGNRIFLGSLYYNYPADVAPSAAKNANMFYIVLLMILFMTLGYWSLEIAIILAPLPLLFGSVTKLIPLPLYVTAPIEILAFIIVYILNKNG